MLIQILAPFLGGLLGGILCHHLSVHWRVRRHEPVDPGLPYREAPGDGHLHDLRDLNVVDPPRYPGIRIRPDDPIHTGTLQVDPDDDPPPNPRDLDEEVVHLQDDPNQEGANP